MAREHRIIRIADRYQLQCRRGLFCVTFKWVPYGNYIGDGVFLPAEYDSVEATLASHAQDLQPGEIVPVLNVACAPH